MIEGEFMFSINNRIVLEVYKKQELKAETSGGFARMAHKISLAQLKVLVDAKLSDGTIIPKRSIAYVREEYLHNNTGRGVTITEFSNKDVSEEPFIILDISQVEIILTECDQIARNCKGTLLENS